MSCKYGTEHQQCSLCCELFVLASSQKAAAASLDSGSAGEAGAARSPAVYQSVLELLDWGQHQEQDPVPYGSGTTS